jgi:tight adherence protein B
MSMVILVATAFACLAVAEAAYYLIRYSGERQRSDLRRRLRSLQEQATASLLRERRVAKNEDLDRQLRVLPFTAELEKLLIQTDLSWTVASMFGLGVLAGVVVSGLLMALLGGGIGWAWVGMPIGFALPIVVALIARQRRSAALSSQLPEALDMMVRSLRAGHGLSAAFKLVASEMPVPIAVEFARCFEEHNIGVEFRHAIEHMTERVPNNLDLKIFAVSVVLQHETGGNLIEILEQIGHTIRERYKFYGKLAALTAEGKVSGTILGTLPFFTVAVISAGNASYLSVLVEDPIGHYFIATALLLWLAGIAWLARLAKVDY